MNIASLFSIKLDQATFLCSWLQLSSCLKCVRLFLAVYVAMPSMNIYSNISFCFPQKKDSRVGLERYECILISGETINLSLMSTCTNLIGPWQPSRRFLSSETGATSLQRKWCASTVSLKYPSTRLVKDSASSWDASFSSWRRSQMQNWV